MVECYFVFDKTSYITGLNTIKNTAPYSGVSLNFCALQLDDGPVKTSTICFDNSGIDPNHPYVIAKVRLCLLSCAVATKLQQQAFRRTRSTLANEGQGVASGCADRIGSARVQPSTSHVWCQRPRRKLRPATGFHILVHVYLQAMMLQLHQPGQLVMKPLSACCMLARYAPDGHHSLLFIMVAALGTHVMRGCQFCACPAMHCV